MSCQDDYEIIIPTIRLDLAETATKSMSPLVPIIRHSTQKAHSFSRLINKCIVSANSEIVIICADKVRPKHTDVKHMLDLIGEGYGLVAFCRFYFFGFKKDLIRKIGFFDERYVRGGFEDWDMVRRLKEADIAFYEHEQVRVVKIPTTWDYDCALSSYPAALHLKNKWGDSYRRVEKRVNRRLPEEKYKYDLGPSMGNSFLNWQDHTVICDWRREKNMIIG